MPLYPSKSETESKNIVGYLGHYLPWDGHKNAVAAIKMVQTYEKWTEGI